MKPNRRTFLKASLGGLAGLAAFPAFAASAAPLTLGDRIRVIPGMPGNVVVLKGGDGLVLVDSGSADHAPALMKSLVGERVRTLINTHYHADQTGGNALFAKAGAEIRVHAITTPWLAADYWSPAQDRWIKAPPKEAVPTVSFRDQGAMTSGAEHIEYGYLLEAHTRGDAYVLFRDSNVLAVGDVASPLRDPVHDWFAGGWIGGRVDAMDQLLKLANADTRIVPAYGAVMTRAQLQAERDMMSKLFDKTSQLTAKGHNAKDMLDAGALKDVGRTFQDPYRFLYDVAKGLQAHYTNFAGNVV